MMRIARHGHAEEACPGMTVIVVGLRLNVSAGKSNTPKEKGPTFVGPVWG
jgi:hypothetical protein